MRMTDDVISFRFSIHFAIEHSEKRECCRRVCLQNMQRQTASHSISGDSL